MSIFNSILKAFGCTDVSSASTHPTAHVSSVAVPEETPTAIMHKPVRLTVINDTDRPLTYMDVVCEDEKTMLHTVMKTHNLAPKEYYMSHSRQHSFAIRYSRTYKESAMSTDPLFKAHAKKYSVLMLQAIMKYIDMDPSLAPHFLPISQFNPLTFVSNPFSKYANKEMLPPDLLSEIKKITAEYSNPAWKLMDQISEKRTLEIPNEPGIISERIELTTPVKKLNIHVTSDGIKLEVEETHVLLDNVQEEY